MPTTSRGSRKDCAALEARRFHAAQLFARGESQAAVARVLGVTTAAANHWHQVWQSKGRRGLKGAGRAGRKPRLDAKQWARVERARRAGPGKQGFTTELWTLPRVGELIQRITGVRHHPGHVWRLLRARGWSLQRPARRARERDDAAIEQWKTRRWAQLKKTPDAGAPGSSSRTRAASRSNPSSVAPGPRAAKRRS
ncbi:MAG: transposase [Candidatus Rokubacteria bacterium]|nr:transposase [Candidatus Rokubacteria bacterium]